MAIWRVEFYRGGRACGHGKWDCGEDHPRAGELVPHDPANHKLAGGEFRVVTTDSAEKKVIAVAKG